MPVELSKGVELCPEYLGMLFEDAGKRDIALGEVQSALDELDVQDFVLLALDYSGDSGEVIYRWALFLVLATFSKAMKQHVEMIFPGEEFDEYEPDDFMHEQFVEARITENVESDDVVASSPAHLDSQANWDVASTAGFGVFADRVVWTRERLLDIVHGAGDRWAVNFTDSVAPANRPAWERMVNNVAEVTRGTEPWPRIIGKWLEESAVLTQQIGIAIRMTFCSGLKR
ncbi:hypothetical protein [Streptomyces sp. L7]|uniref:hypothetical protein n=1 Tax=Streptomyces sp. L7 TaxID=3423954 RepID=UPI003D956329